MILTEVPASMMGFTAIAVVAQQVMSMGLLAEVVAGLQHVTCMRGYSQPWGTEAKFCFVAVCSAGQCPLRQQLWGAGHNSSFCPCTIAIPWC